jgi:hypothetical protein
MDAVRNVFDNFNYESSIRSVIFDVWQPTRCNRPDFFRKLLRIREYGWIFC